MSSFEKSVLEKYKAEAQEKWGSTVAYLEHKEKTKNYSEQKWNNLIEDMDSILAEFAICMKNEKAPESAEAQGLVKTLQDFITDNYYLCTKEILSGLGQMYVADERFMNNIDKHADGTAAFISDSIEIYCLK